MCPNRRLPRMCRKGIADAAPGERHTGCRCAMSGSLQLLRLTLQRRWKNAARQQADTDLQLMGNPRCPSSEWRPCVARPSRPFRPWPPWQRSPRRPDSTHRLPSATPATCLRVVPCSYRLPASATSTSRHLGAHSRRRLASRRPWMEGTCSCWTTAFTWVSPSGPTRRVSRSSRRSSRRTGTGCAVWRCRVACTSGWR